MRGEYAMLAADRTRRILEFLRANGRAQVRELAEALQVSQATVRRDLFSLERQGALLRTRGGALSREWAGWDPPFEAKAHEHADQKRRIARRALELVVEGDTIILDAGTTTRELARLIKGFKHLTVVTHDLNIATALADQPGIDVYQVSGQVERLQYATVGAQTVEYYRGIKVDKAFMGADSIHPHDGLMVRTAERAAIKVAIARAARQVIVLADHTKLEATALFRGLEAGHVDTLITSEGADPALIEQFQLRGVTVTMA